MTLKILRWLLLLAVLGALSLYVSTHTEAFRFILQVDAGTLLALLVLQAITLGIIALAFYSVARSFGLRVPFVSWLHIYSTSRLLNAVVPQTANAYRAAKLRISHEFPIASYAATLFVFALLSRIYTLILALATVLFIDPMIRLGGIPIVPILTFGLVLAVGGLWCSVRLGRSYRSAINKWLKKVRLSPALANETLAVLCRPTLLMYVFLWTCVNYCLALLTHKICFGVVGADLSFAEIAAFRLSRSLIDMVPLTPGNVGIAEVVYGALSVGFERAASEGIAVSAILSVMSTLSILLFFVISFLASRISRSEQNGRMVKL